MKRTLSNEIVQHVGERVRLQGWLHHQRRLSHVTFLLLRDRTGITQVVITDADARRRVGELGAESVVEIVGDIVVNERAPAGVEVVNPAVGLISPVDAVLPVELRRPTLNAQLPTLLDHAAVALRHPPRRAIAQIAAASVAGFRSTLDHLGFTEVFTPKVVAAATESGANVFPIDWFGSPAYLAQSPQFYKQIMVGVFERVYEVGPVFRAEPHDTARHLAEYVSLDAEVGFITDHRDVMSVVEAVLTGMLASVSESVPHAVELAGLALPRLPDQIPVLSFVEAQEMIERSTGRRTVGEPDLAPADERWLGEWALTEHASDFVFVEGYPMSKRPFYTHPRPSDPRHSNSFDLLFRGLELVTGGQRLHRLDEYEAALAGQSLAPFESYLDAFRYGMPPHGGFAIGLERWVARLTEAANVREVTLFPRDLHRLSP